jgi:hypothetical protein
MANDNIIKFTELSEKVNKVLSTQIGILDSAATNLEALNIAYGKLPSEYFNAIKQGLEIEKKQAHVDKELITLEKKKSQVIKSKIPTLRQLTNFHNAETKAIEKANREREKEQRLLNKTTGLYNKVQAGINNLTKQYNDLALRKELNGKLSDSEVVTLGRLEAKLNKYQGALKRVDANIGKHQRNVGNYKSSFDGLGFSVAQLSREMPAFANSMQTGFMAISNNIPMLVDEINKLKRANVELSASGKPTVSVFKSLGKAIFGWQTLISVGVTLLTVYGAKIFETIFAISEEEKALKEANKQIEEQNKALRENIRLRERSLESTRNFINSSGNLDVFREVLNDLTKDSSKAEAVLAELSERLSKIGITDAKVLQDTKILASDRMVIASNLLAIEENKVKLEKERQRLNTVALEKEQILKDFEDGKISASVRNIKLQSLQTQNLNKTITLQKEIKRLNEANQEIIGKTIEIESESNKKGGKRDTVKALGLKTAEESRAEFQEYAKKVMSVLEENFDIEAGKIDPIKLPPLDSKEFKAGLSELQIATDDFISKLGFKSIEESPLSSLKTFFDGTFEDLILGADNFAEEFAITFNAIGEAAKQTFAMIAQIGEQNYQQELDILQKRYENQLLFAGEGTAARERLEEKYEERRRSVQLKQAKAQKDQALFNAGITTAQSTLAAYASQLIPGDPTSIIRAQVAAGIAAAFGLLQVGFIASQKIPEFKDGVRNFEGGHAIVGDGGVSEIVRTNKGVYATPNKDTLVNLPKGADVFSSHDEYFNNVMGDLGILPSIPKVNVVNNGLTKVDLDQVMSKHFSNIQVNQTTLNKGELKLFVKKQNSITSSNNNRVTFKGFSV